VELKEKVKNEAIKLAGEKLKDLPVIEEQAEETKGAGEAMTRLLVGTDQGAFVGR
jgi:hypothetical protein